MNFINTAKKLISSKDVQDASEDLLFDAAGAILGDPIAMGRLILAIGKSTLFIQNQIFWAKFENFLNGVYVDDDSRLKMAAKLSSYGNKDDNAARIISVIDRADSMRKITFLINASKSLCADYIDLKLYFRICHAISNTLLEDLLFLRDNIDEEDLPYSEEAQGLLSAGLMYMSQVGEVPTYSFTPIAMDVDRFAVSYSDVNRYPNPIVNQEIRKVSVSTPEPKWNVFGETVEMQ